MGVRASCGLALGLALALPAAAWPQVNTERLRGDADGDGLSGQVELQFANRTGNTDLADGGATLALRARRAPFTAFLVADIGAGNARGEATVNRGFLHLRGGRDLGPRVTWEAFAQHEYDRLARLDARSLLGTGPRLTLHAGKRWAAFWGLAYMFEREVVDVAPGAAEPRVQRNHRVSTYLSGRLRTSERVALLATVYVQPRIAETRDTRVLGEATLQVALVGALSLKVGATVRYDGDPPAGVKDLDTAVTTRLAWDF